jgi:glucose/arabinose dehydrogenase
MSRITWALLALVLLALAAPAGAAAAPTFVRLGDFDQPVYAASPADNGERLFVVEKPGVVREVLNGTVRTTPFLDISSEVRSSENERGLLSIAFAPDYATSGLFYVYMTAQPAGELQVREYRRSLADPDRADPVGRIVWRQAHDQADNHNGGTVAIGPDGFLWLATGDGGGANDGFGHARDLNSQLGKMLRIDPRPSGGLGYTVPADNPIAGSPVWAYGLRNPFRFSFDYRGSNDLFIGDVGQSAKEEIDRARFADGLGKGADYGWACREGAGPGPKACDPSAAYVPPIFDYSQSTTRAVAGGVVVRDPGLPTLTGRYLYADTYTAQVHSFDPVAARSTDRSETSLPARNTLVAFGEDGCGHVYVVALGGSVDRIVDGQRGACVQRPTPPPPPPLPGPAPAPGPARPALPDRTSPRVRIRVARGGKVGRRATPRISLVATEACRVTVTARVAGAKLKRVRASLRAGRRTIVRLRATRRGATRIRRALRRHRRVTLIVAVTARDAAGNVGRVQRRLKIRRG